MPKLPSIPPRAITAVFKSPMNPKLWNVELECGHEKWLTRSRRPRYGLKVLCTKCKAGDTPNHEPTKPYEPY